MAEEDSGSKSTGNSGGLTALLILIFIIILVGERIDEGKTISEDGIIDLSQELIKDSPATTAGDEIATRYGIYNPLDALREQLNESPTIVPVDNALLIDISKQKTFDLEERQKDVVDSELAQNATETEDDSEDRLSTLSDLPEFSFKKPFFGIGKLAIDKDIIMTTDMRVRRTAAGAIIGFQEKTARGVIKAGPVSAVGLQWWQIDFENAPDGWVPEGVFSAHTGLYGFLYFFPALFGVLKWVVVGFVSFFILGMLWINRKKSKAKKLREKKKNTELSYKEQKKLEEFERNPIVNEKWQQVQRYMNSQSHVEWRQAILEADIMLDEMLTKIGYAGESVGEKLKNVEESDFITLQKAWDAHKVRNRIAHGGATEVKLDRREAERVIGLYEEVFSEFYYI